MKITIEFRDNIGRDEANCDERSRKASITVRDILGDITVVSVEPGKFVFEAPEGYVIGEARVERIAAALKENGFDDPEISCGEVAATVEEDGDGEGVDGGVFDDIDEILQEAPADELADNFEELIGAVEEGMEEEKNRACDENGKNARDSFGAVQRRIADIRAQLSTKVKGQQHAIDAFVRAYFGAEVLTEKAHKGPLATFLFAGPPGCGKTFLSECAAEFINDRRYARFNMSEYGDFGASVNGFDLGGKSGMITRFVSENPRCIVLFDEIEKASQNNLRLFLQILDSGVIRDLGTREEVSFKDAILIFTTNVAKNLYEDADGSNLSGVIKSSILAAIESDENPATRKPYFPRELVSRWAKGTVVLFNKLEPYAIKEIVLRELKDRISTAERNTGVTIDCDYDKVASLIMYSVGGSGDARTMTGAVSRFIESELFDAVSQLIRRNIDVDKLKKIFIGVDYKKSGEGYLFEVKEKVPVLFAAGRKYAKHVKEACAEAEGVKAIFKSDFESVKEALRGEVGALVLDVFLKEKKTGKRSGDLEDIDSDGAALFEYATARYPEIPVYILNDESKGYDDAAFETFLARGAKGVVRFDTDDGKANAKALDYIKDATVTGNNFYRLSRSSNVLCYNCAQEIEKDGEELRILARRLDVKRSVRAEDMDSVVADVYRPSEKFSDVIGAEEVKKAMSACVEYLKNPKRYVSSGRKAPRGILLYGPPGTGKTMLAKALAGETDVTFIEKNATEFFKKYVGQGSESIRELFRTARRYAPSIIFIDEADAFARERTGSEYTRNAEELLTTFLSETEGFAVNENKPVIVLCATNYGIKSDGDNDGKVLDPAFVRRFDKKIPVGLPDTDDRKALIYHYLSENGVDADKLSVGIGLLAGKTVGYSHAAVKDTVLSAIERSGGRVTDEVLEEARDAEEYGEKKEYSEDCLLRTARHEAGHAIISWACGKTPAYITVVARGPYGGYTMYDIDEEKVVQTKRELTDSVCCALGGRAAELLCYGNEDGLTTGASADLKQATRTASAMVASLGMTPDRLAVTENFGDSVEKEVYAEVDGLMKKELARAKKIIDDNGEAFGKLVEALIERNSLDADGIIKLIGKPPRCEE